MTTTTKPSPLTPAQLTATAATYYSCPANNRAKLLKVTVSNNDTTARTVTMYKVPSGGTAGVTNIITPSQTLAPNQALDLYEIEGHQIDSLDTLQGLADVAAKVTIHVTVVETTK